jgi:hypothetical protein
MPDRPPPKARKRDPIYADRVNLYGRLFEALGLVVRYPLRLIPSGRVTILTYDDPHPRIYARITSAQSGVDLSYNFRQVYRRPGHTWVDGTLTGKCWEMNNLATLVIGDRIRLTKDTTSSDWVGQLDHC